MMSISMPEQFQLNGRTLVLSYSGGKDSGATWLALREHGIEPDHVICADTGWESLEWYDHMRRWQDFIGREVTIVRAEIEVPEHLMPLVDGLEAMAGISPSPMIRLMIRKAMFPSRQRKWCTDDLKHKPCDAWFDELPRPDLAVHVTGVRADESRTRMLYTVDERHPKTAQWHWRPILRWTAADVVSIHHRHRAPLCPLYDRGVSRVGCWPCIPARNKQEVSLLDDRRLAVIRRLEAVVNELNADRRASHTPPLPWGGMLHMAISDYDGIPDIDTAVAHAKTYRGGASRSDATI